MCVCVCRVLTIVSHLYLRPLLTAAPLTYCWESHKNRYVQLSWTDMHTHFRLCEDFLDALYYYSSAYPNKPPDPKSTLTPP